MSEATLNPPSLEQINRDLAKTVSEEMQKNEMLTKALEEIKAEAGTSLKPDCYPTEGDWNRRKVYNIEAMATRALRGDFGFLE